MNVKRWFGYGWATPVTSKPWALIATLHHWLNRKMGYRVFPNRIHWTWQKAVK